MAEEKNQLEENFRWEYREVAANHRFYVSLRFVITAFSATMQSALLNFYVQRTTLDRINLIPSIGILTIIAVFLMERRNIHLFRIMTERGKDLEFKLGLLGGQFSCLIASRKWSKFITYTWSIGVLYMTIGVMWTVLLALEVTTYYERITP